LALSKILSLVLFGGGIGVAFALIASPLIPSPWDDLVCPLVGATAALLAWKFRAYVFRTLDAGKPRFP